MPCLSGPQRLCLSLPWTPASWRQRRWRGGGITRVLARGAGATRHVAGRASWTRREATDGDRLTGAAFGTPRRAPLAPPCPPAVRPSKSSSGSANRAKHAITAALTARRTGAKAGSSRAAATPTCATPAASATSQGACGCGAEFTNPDKWGNTREWLRGHQKRGRANPNAVPVLLAQHVLMMATGITRSQMERPEAVA